MLFFNSEVAEIEHAVCRALNELRAATTKGFDIQRRTIPLERIDHEQVVEKRRERRSNRRAQHNDERGRNVCPDTAT